MKNYHETCDIAVVGAGPAGIAAAVTAARTGKKVLLLEKNGYLGGCLVIGLSPLGFLDEHGEQCIAGFGQEVIDRLKEKGASYGHRYCPKHNSVSNIDAEAAKVLLIEMCREAGVEVLLHAELQEVILKDGLIDQIVLYGKGNRVTVEAKCFLDCTGDGDLGYLAGCSFELGRNGTHDLMPPTVMCTVEGVDKEKLFQYVESHPEEMRPVCDTIDMNPGYDAAYFQKDPNYVFVGLTELFGRLRKEGKNPVDRGNVILINGLHPGEMYVNTTRILHVDATDLKDLTRAELEGQIQNARLIEVMREFVPGFEHAYISSTAPNLGVRESRRMKGIKRVTAEDAYAGAVPEDSICLSGYKIDIHQDRQNDVLFRKVDKPFGIPYGALVSAEIGNLLFAGRCISADDQAIGSIRVMPCCMAMGQAAGLAASMAIGENVLPKEVNVPTLREALRKQGAILNKTVYEG